MKKNIPDSYTKETILAIQKIILESIEMKNSFFKSPPCNASGRRSYEKIHSHDKIEWQENNHKFSAEFSVRCSCHNIYVYTNYFKDGEKTNLTAIKNSYKRMIEK